MLQLEPQLLPNAINTEALPQVSAYELYLMIADQVCFLTCAMFEMINVTRSTVIK